MFWSIAVLLLLVGLGFASSFYGWPGKRQVKPDETRLSRAVSDTFFGLALVSAIWISDYIAIDDLSHGWVRTITIFIVGFLAIPVKKLINGFVVLAAK